MLRRLWLLFAQTVTVALALLFVVATLKPQWLPRSQRPAAVAEVLAPRPCCRPDRCAARSPGPRPATARPARRAAPAVVSVVASKTSRRRAQGAGPVVPLLLRQRPRPVRRTRRVGLGSGVIVSAEGYAADQQPCRRRRRRHRGAARRRPPGARPAGRHRPRDRPGAAADHARQAAGHRPGRRAARCRSATWCWPSATPSMSARRSPRASSARSGATGSGCRPSRTSSRPTPPSTRAIRAARWSMSAGRLVGINTAIYSRSGGSLGIGFAIPVDCGARGDGRAAARRPGHARLDRRRAARPERRDWPPACACR